MSTKATGTFQGCGDTFSITYTCEGPSCSKLNGLPQTTCESAGSGLFCSNGVTCPETARVYTSDFVFTQDQNIVTQTQTVDMGPCGKFTLRSDGTASGTTADDINKGPDSCYPDTRQQRTSPSSSSSPPPMSSSATSSSATSPPGTSSTASSSPPGTSTPGPSGTSIAVTVTSNPSATSTGPIIFNSEASVRRVSTSGILCFLLLVLFLVQGTSALGQHVNDAPVPASLQLHERADNPLIVFADALGDFLGTNANANPDPATAKRYRDTFVKEFESALCDWGLNGGSAGALLFPWDLASACTKALLGIGWTGGAKGEFVAVLASGTACNFAASFFLSHKNASADLIPLLTATCGNQKPPVDACALSKRDLLSDPNNCGACGVVCPSGICKNGACAAKGCDGKTCDTFVACGPGSTCVCASTPEGTGFCVDGLTQCEQLAECNDSAHCGAGEVCVVKTCCAPGTLPGVCVGATFCGGSNPVNGTMLFRKSLRHGNTIGGRHNKRFV